MRRSSDLGVQAGYQRRTRDVLAWAKKRRRHIRREELIAFLTGKSLPGTAGSHQPMMRPMRMGPRPRVCLSTSDSGASHGASAHPLMDGSLASAGGVEFEPALQAFREALSLPPPSSKSATSAGRRASPVHNHNSELSAFISHESARHKRPAPLSSGASPSHDVTMDSPTHKRSRLM